jgi:hypothetical protein
MVSTTVSPSNANGLHDAKRSPAKRKATAQRNRRVRAKSGGKPFSGKSSKPEATALGRMYSWSGKTSDRLSSIRPRGVNRLRHLGDSPALLAAAGIGLGLLFVTLFVNGQKHSSRPTRRKTR